jgi:hypothetical protein
MNFRRASADPHLDGVIGSGDGDAAEHGVRVSQDPDQWKHALSPRRKAPHFHGMSAPTMSITSSGSDRPNRSPPPSSNKRTERMTNEGKRIAKYAAVGALVGIPLPIVGPVIGGIVGAVLGANKNKRLHGRPY